MATPMMDDFGTVLYIGGELPPSVMMRIFWTVLYFAGYQYGPDVMDGEEFDPRRTLP
jgi:hypothetical protein